MKQAGASLTSVVAGFRLLFEGARLLRREPRLWGPAVVPLLLSFAAFGTAIGLVVAYAEALYGLATAWMPTLEATRWYAWLWVGPARAALGALGALLFLAAAGACLVVAYLVASVLAAPFHDALSARVERVVTGGLDDRTGSGISGLLREAARSVLAELQKLAFFAAVVVPLVVVGFAVPGAQLVCGPAVFAFTLFFLPLDYASYTLDRRHVAFRERRRWVLSRVPVMAGFGLGAWLVCAVPLLNLVAMPLLVVAGTLLALRHLPRSAAAAGPGSQPAAPR